MAAAAHIRLLPRAAADPDSADPEIISPELALVDPELARAARALLPDPPWCRGLRPATSALSGPRAASDLVEHATPAEETVVASATPLPAETFAPRHFVAGFVLGLLLAALAVEGYVLSSPLRSGSSSEQVVTVPRSATPAPVAEPEVGTPAIEQPATVPSRRARKPVAPAPRPPTVLAWPASPGSAAYQVVLFRAGRRVYERTVRSERLPLPSSWRYAGRRRRLLPGTYRWVVRPLRNDGAVLRPLPPIVDAAYVVTRSRP